MRYKFIRLNEVCTKLMNIENICDAFTGYNRFIISIESESNLSIIGLGKRKVSSIEIDKYNNRLSINKTWPFFSDKIKILFEKDGNVFLLNSEKYFCVTNSRNQAMIRVLSDQIFNQAIMFSNFHSDSIFLLGECNALLLVFELYNTEIINRWDIGTSPITSQISLRGNFFVVKSLEHILILQFKFSDSLPYKLIKFKSEYAAIDVLGNYEVDDCCSLNILGYSVHETHCTVSISNTSDPDFRNSIEFGDASIYNSKLEFGKFLCLSGNYFNRNSVNLLVGTKIIKSTSFNIESNSYSFQNLCRNMYGEAIQVKYFENLHGISYFLSLHQRYFLIFIVATSRSGTLEISMLKSISIPENEFMGDCLEIVLTGTNKVYLRDDSNAYEISLDVETNDTNLLDHCLPIKPSSIEFILSLLSRQDINQLCFRSFMDNFLLMDFISDLEDVISFIESYQSSVDLHALRSIFSAALRYRLPDSNFSANFLDDLVDYEILSSFNSDSQV